MSSNLPWRGIVYRSRTGYYSWSWFTCSPGAFSTSAYGEDGRMSWSMGCSYYFANDLTTSKGLRGGWTRDFRTTYHRTCSGFASMAGLKRNSAVRPCMFIPLLTAPEVLRRSAFYYRVISSTGDGSAGLQQPSAAPPLVRNTVHGCHYYVV